MRAVRAALVAVSVLGGLAAPAGTGLAAPSFVFTLAGWNQAVATGFDGVTLIQRPLAIADALFYDAAGGSTPYRETSEEALIQTIIGFTPFEPRPRSVLFGDRKPVRIENGNLIGSFGCFSPVWPCLGLTMAVLTFPQPIWGLAGFLDYWIGEEMESWGTPFGQDPMIEPFRSGWRAANGGSLSPPPPGRWDTFFGMLLFDEPVETLTLLWRENTGGLDARTGFVLRQARMLVEPAAGESDDPIGVPEPGALALLATALLALVLLPRPAPLRGRARSPT